MNIDQIQSIYWTQDYVDKLTNEQRVAIAIYWGVPYEFKTKFEDGKCLVSTVTAAFDIAAVDGKLIVGCNPNLS